MRPISYLVATSTAALFVWGGCAASHPPTAMWLQAEQAVKQASASGAEEYAPLPLRSAQVKLESSRQAEKRNHPKEAQLLAEETMVDAELAAVTSQAAKAQKAKVEIDHSIEALNQGIQK